MRWRKRSRLRNRPSDNANVAGSAPSGRSRHLPQRSAGVEDEHRNAGTNGGQQGKAGQVLAVPPKCAVRDGVELLDQATDMVAKGAVKSRCYAANWKNPIRLTDPVVDYSGGHTYGPKKCTQNRTYATSRNYHDDP